MLPTDTSEFPPTANILRQSPQFSKKYATQSPHMQNYLKKDATPTFHYQICTIIWDINGEI